MNIDVTIESQKAKNLRAVAKLIARGVPFENAMGRVMRAQAKREGQKPTKFEKHDRTGVRDLRGLELFLLRNTPFNADRMFAASLDVELKTLKYRAWYLTKRGFAICHGQGPLLGQYEITEKGLDYLKKHKDDVACLQAPEKFVDLYDALGAGRACLAELAEITGRPKSPLRQSLRRMIESGMAIEVGDFRPKNNPKARKVKHFERVE